MAYSSVIFPALSQGNVPQLYRTRGQLESETAYTAHVMNY